MSRSMACLVLMLVPTSLVCGQGVALFQDGVTELPGGGLYEGTIDTEFRAAAPTEPQFENVNISVDQFDGGFQTQGAIRFTDLLVSEGGLVPDELPREGIIFAELAIWKQSPSQSDANIDFNRVVGPDTTTGEFWDEEDTWASLGGDLIPDEGGLLDGDPITRDDVEAASAFEFQDSATRFGPDQVVTLDPTEPPIAANLVYRTDADSEDVFDDAWDGTPEDLNRAIDVAKWRFDVTDAFKDWLADTDPETAGTQPAAPNFGWSISNDTGDGWDFISSEIDFSIESEFDGLSEEEFLGFRPALTIIFDDGSAGPLDINKDGDIDLVDFDEFVGLLGGELDGPLATGSPGDFDFNRRVNLDDFKFFKENFPGGEAALQLALDSRIVPEPSSYLLVLFGLLGTLALRRRSR